MSLNVEVSIKQPFIFHYSFWEESTYGSPPTVIILVLKWLAKSEQSLGSFNTLHLCNIFQFFRAFSRTLFHQDITKHYEVYTALLLFLLYRWRASLRFQPDKWLTQTLEAELEWGPDHMPPCMVLSPSCYGVSSRFCPKKQ